jgi:hypothetical protein
MWSGLPPRSLIRLLRLEFEVAAVLPFGIEELFEFVRDGVDSCFLESSTG